MRDSPDSIGQGFKERSGLALPGDEATWKNSQLGPFANWPHLLCVYTTTISAITYPAAILWGNDYVLVHNKPWDKAGGIHYQGEAQRHRLAPETLKILDSVVEGMIPKEVQSDDLFREDATASKQSWTAMLTPLMNADEVRCHVIMVQLLPKPMLYQPSQPAANQGSVVDHTARLGGRPDEAAARAKSVDNVALDEHPFFRRFAEVLPSGLAILDHNAEAVFVNEHFYDLTTLKEENRSFSTWPQSIHPDDYERVMDAYETAFRGQQELRTEFRAQGEPNAWRLLLLTPLGDDNLQHVSLQEYGGFICSIVDISSEKSAKLSERKAATQARERKDQQERFIDMISHEIRNPLSAVLHCAEDIEDAVRDNDGSHVDVDTIREAVETIHLCCTHQKNIVDDILSFSKLDASLLSLVPKASEPSRQLRKTLSIFKHEFKKEKLHFTYSIDKTYDDVEVGWVMADVARVSQVLINLITNAIKFTHNTTGEKLIDCHIAASVERPKSYPPNILFFKSDNLAFKMDATNTPEWGNREAIYIMVAVIDTGIGISEEGQHRLFGRFQQATPRTEEVYGGSGLGLNISRKICHLHGGEIGVSSKEGEGSTFGFFFKVKRTDPPRDERLESIEETEGKEQARNKIELLSQQTPEVLDPTESFEWSSDSAKGQSDSRTAESSTSKDNAQARDKDFAKREGEQTSEMPHISDRKPKPVRPPLAQQRRGSQKLVSESLSTPESPSDGSKDLLLRGNRDDRRTHVLLVEDNVINQRLLFRKLETKGFNVTCADNGQEAVNAVKAAPKRSSRDKAAFDVILMDQEMPILDGNAAARAIRELEKQGQAEHIPILGVSANVRGAQQDEMLASGMDDVLTKPYKIEDLVEKINEIIVIDE